MVSLTVLPGVVRRNPVGSAPLCYCHTAGIGQKYRIILFRTELYASKRKIICTVTVVSTRNGISPAEYGLVLPTPFGAAMRKQISIKHNSIRTFAEYYNYIYCYTVQNS